MAHAQPGRTDSGGFLGMSRLWRDGHPDRHRAVVGWEPVIAPGGLPQPEVGLEAPRRASATTRRASSWMRAKWSAPRNDSA